MTNSSNMVSEREKLIQACINSLYRRLYRKDMGEEDLKVEGKLGLKDFSDIPTHQIRDMFAHAYDVYGTSARMPNNKQILGCWQEKKKILDVRPRPTSCIYCEGTGFVYTVTEFQGREYRQMMRCVCPNGQALSPAIPVHGLEWETKGHTRVSVKQILDRDLEKFKKQDQALAEMREALDREEKEGKQV